MAFPSTAILDNFNRADQNPLTGNWTKYTTGGNKDLKLVSSQVAHVDGLTSGGAAFWNPSSYAAPLEVYASTVVVGINMGLDYCRNDGANNFYRFQTGPNPNTVGLWRCDAGGFTQIGGDYAVTLANVTAIGVSFAVGGIHSLYYFPSGGGWTFIATVSDATYSSGNLGLFITTDATLRWDNFGGGAPILAPSDVPPHFRGGRGSAW